MVQSGEDQVRAAGTVTAVGVPSIQLIGIHSLYTHSQASVLDRIQVVQPVPFRHNLTRKQFIETSDDLRYRLLLSIAWCN